MKTFITVHAVAVNNAGEYLVLQRADHRSDPGLWNFATGFIQDRESAEEAASRELKEETNLEGEIVKTTEPSWVDINGKRWVIIASLIKISDTSQIKIDKTESKAYKWIKPNDPIVSQSKGLKASFRELGIISK